MRRASLAIAGVLVAGGAVALQRAVLASDHLDGPRTTSDPQADIADVFAFTSPENPAHVVLAMTVAPFAAVGADASPAASFATDVDYVFRIRRVLAPSPFTLDAAVLDVTCEFDSSDPQHADRQHATCVAPNGLVATATVGDTAGGGDASSPYRLFAGPRSDPAFFDRQGALTTMATGKYGFTGQNAFRGANVLAIVIEIDSLAAFGEPADAGDAGSRLPILAVAAETVRRSH
jgi:hypothetical protein